MLNSQAFASAAAAASSIFYLALVVTRFVAPPFFKLIFNSQFLGADIASQLPSASPANVLGFLIAIATVSWIFGYLIAQIYNRFSK